MKDHPIDDSYWVIPGQFLAGEYPGALQEAAALEKLNCLLDSGVTLFVDLTQAGEYQLRPYAPAAQQLGQQRGSVIDHKRWSIPDMGTPDHTTMVAILDQIDAALAQGHGVYVHCFGGIGRTGTVVGCYFVRHGLTGRQALAEIAQRRMGTPDGYRRSPETEAQRHMVLTWREDNNA